MNKGLKYDKVVHGYSVAVVYKYDVKSIADVIKILKKIDRKNANEEYAKEFSKMLQLFDMMVKKKLKPAGKKKVVN